MPSFDISSEADMVALKNAIDVADRQIDNRYDFKGTSAKVELNEKDKTITLLADSDFQLDQIKDILFPAMEKKEAESTKRLDAQDVDKISGNIGMTCSGKYTEVLRFLASLSSSLLTCT